MDQSVFRDTIKRGVDHIMPPTRGKRVKFVKISYPSQPIAAQFMSRGRCWRADIRNFARDFDWMVSLDDSIHVLPANFILGAHRVRESLTLACDVTVSVVQSVQSGPWRPNLINISQREGWLFGKPQYVAFC